mmetsp:Transcript_46869/g.106103  ORF Transcript_46869/g.106103 Transcript_46869/m.106103 type:complete len:220 (+) Transcript_46869:229-888(+)
MLLQIPFGHVLWQAEALGGVRVRDPEVDRKPLAGLKALAKSLAVGAVRQVTCHFRFREVCDALSEGGDLLSHPARRLVRGGPVDLPEADQPLHPLPGAGQELGHLPKRLEGVGLKAVGGPPRGHQLAQRRHRGQDPGDRRPRHVAENPHRVHLLVDFLDHSPQRAVLGRLVHRVNELGKIDLPVAVRVCVCQQRVETPSRHFLAEPLKHLREFGPVYCP